MEATSSRTKEMIQQQDEIMTDAYEHNIEDDENDMDDGNGQDGTPVEEMTG